MKSYLSISNIPKSIEIRMSAIPHYKKKKTDFYAWYNISCSELNNFGDRCYSWHVEIKKFNINHKLSALYPKGEIAKSALRNLLSVIRKRSPSLETSITLNAVTEQMAGMIGMYYWSKMGFEILRPTPDLIEDLVSPFVSYLSQFDIARHFDMEKLDEFLKSLSKQDNMPYALTMLAYFNGNDYIPANDYNNPAYLLLGRRFLLETDNLEVMVLYPMQTNRKSTQLFLRNLAIGSNQQF